MKQARENEGRRITHYTGNHVNTFNGLEDYVKRSKEIFKTISSNLLSKQPQQSHLTILNANGELSQMKHLPGEKSRSSYEKLKAIRDVEQIENAKGYMMVNTNIFSPTTRERSSITNISINRYSKSGKKSKEALDITIKPDGTGMAIFERLINKVEKSSDSILKLKPNEIERAIELMKYSKKETVYSQMKGNKGIGRGEGNKNQIYQYINGKTDSESKLNILSSELGVTIEHMKSGLHTLKNEGLTMPQASKKMNEFLEKHKSEVIISTNSSEKDLDVLANHLRGKLKDELKEKRTFNVNKVVKDLAISNPKASSGLLGLYELSKDNGVLTQQESVNKLVSSKSGVKEKKDRILKTINPTKEMTSEEIAKSQALQVLEKGSYYKPKKEFKGIGSDVSIAVKNEEGSLAIRSLKNNPKLNNEDGNLLKFEGFYDLSENSKEKMIGAKFFNMAEQEDVFIIKKGENRLEEMEKTLFDLFSNESEEVLTPQNLKEEFGGIIAKKYEGPNSRFGGYTLRAFEEYQNVDSFIALDIETMGDTSLKEGTRFDVTEIAAAEYDKQGNQIGKAFSRVARPSNQTINELEITLERFRQDPTILNTLSDAEKRAFVDVMRYSTSKEGSGVDSFKIVNGDVIHNNLVEDFLTHDGRIDYPRVLDKPSYYELHIKSGIESLKGMKYSQVELAKDISDYLGQRRDKLLLTYNGMNFDVPVMNRFSLNQIGKEVPQMNHLDLYQYINTIQPDLNELSKTLGANVKDFRLQTLASGLSSDGSKHSAVGDILTLAQVTPYIEKATKKKLEQIKKEKINTKYPKTDKRRMKEASGEALISIDERPVEVGDTYSVKKSYNAFRDNDESFLVRRNEETGKMEVTPYGNGKYATESGGHYSYRGILKLNQKGEESKYALRMKSLSTDSESYIIRSGPTALAELEGILHSHFKPDVLRPDQIERNRMIVEADRARRAYDRFFDVSSGPQGVFFNKDGEYTVTASTGFEGAKKFFTVAAEEKQIKEFMEENPNKYAFDEEGFLEERLPKEKDREYYRKIKDRLMEEAPIYGQAINAIDSLYEKKLNEAIARRDQPSVNEIINKKNEAIYRFHRDFQEESNQYAENKVSQLGRTKIDRFYKIDSSSGESISLNVSDFDTAKSSLSRYVRSRVDSGTRNKDKEIETLFEVVDAMLANESIGRKRAMDIKDKTRKSGSYYTGVNLLAGEFFGDVEGMPGLEYTKSPEVPNMAAHAFAETEEGKALGRSLISDIMEETKEGSGFDFKFNKETNQYELNVSDKTKALIGDRRSIDPKTGKYVGTGNIEAIENIAKSIKFTKSNMDNLQFAIDVVEDGGLRADFYVYDNKDHSTVFKAIEEGTGTSKAMKFTIPLIDDNKVQTLGRMVSNSHQILNYNQGKYELETTVETLSRKINFSIQNAIEQFSEGDRDRAERLLKTNILEVFQTQAGINRGASGYSKSDTLLYAQNLSDALKQSYIDVESASIRSMFEEGFEGFQLKEKDFNPSAFYYDKNNEKKLKNDLTMRDLNADAQYEVKKRQFDWADQKLEEFGVQTYSSGVKTDKIGRYVSTVDGRDSIIFGAFSDAKRDNMIQWTNSFKFFDKDIGKLEGIEGIQFERSIQTDFERESGAEAVHKMTANYAIMDDDMITKRILDLDKTEEGKRILQESGMYFEDGTIDWSKAPRTHEQQISVSEDVYRNLNVENTKSFATENRYELAEGYESGNYAKPGAVFAYEIESDGTRTPIENRRNSLSQIEFDPEHPEELKIKWEAKAHKVMEGGDKGTLMPVKQELIDAITGMENIHFIHNPDVSKHLDFNLLYSGEVLKITDRVLNESDPQTREAMAKAVDEANLGIKWDSENQYFRDVSNNSPDFTPGTSYKDVVGRLDNLFENEYFSDIQRSVTIENQDGTKMDIHSYRNETTISGVYEYADVYGEDGRQFVGVGENGPEFSGKRGGVRYGHRELRTFENLGMNNFYNHVLERIVEEDALSGKGTNMTKFEYLENLHGAARQFEQGSSEGDRIIRHTEFNQIPKGVHAKEAFEGTVFDTDFVKELSGRKDGFWLELPSHTENGVTIHPEYTNEKGEKEEIKRLFIPNTRNAYLGGERYNDQIQANIQSILRRAEAIDEAKTSQERSHQINALGKDIDKFRERLTYEMTSSKGLAGEVGSIRMGNSYTNASAKSLDAYRSEELKKSFGINTEFAMISKDAAIGMGIYDRIKEGEEVFGAVTRYPVFNEKATVFAQLKVDEDILDNTVHITENMREMLKADNDGDTLHIVAAPTAEIEKEFKAMAKINEERFVGELYKGRQQYQSTLDYLSGETGESVDTIHKVIQNEDFSVLEKNTPGELASKIGRSLIGSASNYNLVLQQAAGLFYSPESREHQMIQDFGSAIEQRIISSKHGASDHATELIQALNRNDWETARRIDTDFYDGMFQKEYNMKEVEFFMKDNIKSIDGGLYNPNFSLGKGAGLLFSSPEKASELMNNDFHNPMNHFTKTYRHLQDPDILNANQNGRNPISELDSIEFQNPVNKKYFDEVLLNEPERFEAPVFERMREKIPEEVVERHRSRDGNNPPLSDPRTRDVIPFERGAQGMPNPTPSFELPSGRSTSLMAAGLGGVMLGAAGSTIFNSSTPTKEDFENYTSNKTHEDRLREIQDKDFIGSSYLGVTRGDDYQGQSQNLRIRAQGDSLSKLKLPSAVSSNLGTKSDIHVRTSDNVSKLSNNWYRDRVRENI